MTRTRGQTVIDDAISKHVTLRKRVNTIRAAIINAGGAPVFSARIIAEEGHPVKRVTLRLDTGMSSR